jgi:CHAT domain-containing protein/tetratricopeptide (TPR) repeat protein
MNKRSIFLLLKLSILYAIASANLSLLCKIQGEFFQMSRITFTQRFVHLLITILLCCLLLSIATFAQTSSEDLANFHRLIEQYFAAHEKRDLNALTGMWDATSPDFSSNKKSLEELFAAAQKIEIKILSIGKITLNAGKVRLPISVEINAINAKSGKPIEGLGKLNRTLHLTNVSGEWKIWQTLSSEEELASAIVEMKTEAEGKQFLETNKELVTVALVQALLTQGRRIFVQSRNAQAFAIYKLVREIANQLNDKKGTVAALRGIGNTYLRQGDYSQALEYYDNSLKLAEEIDDKTGIGNALGNIGLGHQYLGNYAKSLEYYQKSLKIAEENGDKAVILTTLNNIGNIHQFQSHYPQALEYFQKSLKLAQDTGNKLGVGLALGNIGIVYQYQGNYTQSLEHHQSSLKIAEEMGNKAGIGNAMHNIGLVHQLQGNYTQALDYYYKSLKIAEDSGNKTEIGIRLDSIGIAYQYQGNDAKALENHQRSLKLAEEIGNKIEIAIRLNNIGSIYQSQGNHTQALENYQRSLKIAEELGNKAGIGNVLNNIGRVYQSRDNNEQAIEFANRAADLAQQINSPGQLWESRILAGQAYHTLNQPEQAKKAFADAIAAIEETRNQIAGDEQQQQQFFAEKLSPYYGMVGLLIGQHNLMEAFAFAERAKARALLGVLQTGKLNITRAMTLTEKQQEQKFNSELVSLNAQIYKEKLLKQQDQKRLDYLNSRLNQARLEMEAFQTSLYAAHPELKIQRGQVQTITLSEAATLIPDSKTALLEFVVSDDQTYLFILTKNASQSAPDLKVYTIDIKQKELAKLCSDFRQRLADRRISYQDIAAKLYNLLLKPVRTQLMGKTNWVIIPDGVLWELPFQALQPARNHFLIEDCAISYAPSLTVLQKMVKAGKRNTMLTNTLLAVGNPIIGTETSTRVKTVFMDEQLLPLPDAERQVKLLQKLYTPSRSIVYIGQQAGEAKVKAEAGNSRILHLATHGILNDASPMYSQIVLAHNEADTNEDGLLEAWEIMNLELNADLVVLSACETARGKLGAGEGMIGLAWAFFVAGSPATVVSQWKVESVSTTELMVAFHKNLQTATDRQNPKMTKAEAMRRAALKLLKTQDYRHPFYWAAFVIIGDAS